MKKDIINRLLSNKVKNPSTGEFVKVDINDIFIEEKSLEKLAGYIESNLDVKNISIVSDENTHEVAGAFIEQSLAGKFQVTSIVLDDGVAPEISVINEVCSCALESDLLIAVGGGTISDITKYASKLIDKDYICAPTCPSVNGFTSSTASIIDEDGIKKSLDAKLPIAVFFDLDVAINAPDRLIISGLGDSIARVTAQFDQILGEFFIGSEYNPLPFEILEDDEENLFENAEKLLSGDKQAMESLCRVLILSGLGMHILGSSAPASQSEHLLAHYMETMFEGKYQKTFHGEQIAVTSIAIAKIQEDILTREKLQIKPIIHSEKPIFSYFGEEKGEYYLRQIKGKELSCAKVTEINKKLEENWEELQEKLEENFINSEALQKIIASIDGPYTYRHLGWEFNDFRNAIAHSALTRNRFTCLDLAMGVNDFEL